jgi:hypothetical protein
MTTPTDIFPSAELHEAATHALSLFFHLTPLGPCGLGTVRRKCDQDHTEATTIVSRYSRVNGQERTHLPGTDKITECGDAMGILNGWKEIAECLNRTPRSARRWERLGLPVFRLSSSSRSPVVAFSHEIENWVRKKQQRGDRPKPVDVNVSACKSTCYQTQKLLRQSQQLFEQQQQLRTETHQLLAEQQRLLCSIDLQRRRNFKCVIQQTSPH